MRAWKIVKWLVLGSLSLFILIFVIFGFNEEASRINIRLSARIAAIIFATAFMSSSLQRFVKGQYTFWLLANRKFLGISFALIHLIHLALLGLLQFYFHPIFEVAATKSLIGGGIAYFFVVLMLLTSFERFSSHLHPKTWKRLHSFGGYWIWFIFMRSYWVRVDTEIEYLPLVLLFAVVLLLRLTKVFVPAKLSV